MFHTADGLYFTRDQEGNVTITKTVGEGADHHVIFQQTLSWGSWISVVLTMSAFDERSGDFERWSQHHLGRKDILRAQDV